ncbi:MAG: head-tail connector protein [Deltaproteobacteria bacterium]|nr:head-tail connector protein [Deltaproteobacteria bacterium]
MSRDLRQRHMKRFNALLTIRRSSWEPVYRDLSYYMAPRRSRFFQTEATTAGQKKEARIINNTATIAVRTQAAGMMAGITSPARPWYSITTADPDLAERDEVMGWTSIVEQRLRMMMLKSNLYNGLQVLYPDISVFGTSPMFLDNDGPGQIRAYPIPVGEYVLGLSDRGVVDTLYRETSLSVSQLVKKFEKPGQPLKVVSQRVRDLYNAGNYDALIEVLHVVCPREEYDHTRPGPLNMPFASCWMEKDAEDGAPLLSEKGYEVFPVVAPRWAVTSLSDAYGYGPGYEALGDVKELQLLERKSSLVAELLADPPVNAGVEMQMRQVSMLPGAVNYVDDLKGPSVVPAIQVNPQALPALEGRIRAREEKINAAFSSNLWLMMSEQDEQGQPVTAREVAERHEEKMLQLGPVLERLTDELLNPMVSRYYGVALAAGLLPPPPKVLARQPLRVEYTSIMAQAMKAAGFSGLEQFTSFVGNLAQVNPDVLDVVDFDEVAYEAGRSLGANPKVMRPPEQVQQRRAQRQKQQQAEAAAKQGLAAAQAAKNLGQASTGPDTALGQLGGIAAAQGAPDNGGQP